MFAIEYRSDERPFLIGKLFKLHTFLRTALCLSISIQRPEASCLVSRAIRLA